PVETRRDTIGALGELLAGRRVSFEGVLPYALYERLRRAGVDLDLAGDTVERLRAVKDERELASLRNACAITDRAYERLTQVRFGGRTERDVSWELRQIFHDEGAEDVAFEFIVGAGPTGSSPHARAGDRVMKDGELG